MVIKVMTWRPWPLILTRRFKVKLTVHSLKDVSNLICTGDMELCAPAQTDSDAIQQFGFLMVNLKWKDSKGTRSRLALKRRSKKDSTAMKTPHDSSVVTWEEEFEQTCIFAASKDGGYLPLNVSFVISQVSWKPKPVVLGSASINLVDLVIAEAGTKQTCIIPVPCLNDVGKQGSLLISVNAVEVPNQESGAFELRMAPTLACISGPSLCELEDNESTLMAKKMLSITNAGIIYGENVSLKSNQSSDSSRNSFESDSMDELEEEGAMEKENDPPIHMYGPLAGVNLVVEGALPHISGNSQVKPLETTFIHNELNSSKVLLGSSSPDPATQSTVQSFLSWRKRKLSFRSPHRRGQPLLNKDYGEDGGDDIDFDRRLTGSPLGVWSENDNSSFPFRSLDFGDECFAVGSWEKKDFVSRDGEMKLSANVFFASIDQRNERAGGGSACTALVAVIADWLHRNPDRMPIKAELDTLIREGSAEWRKLCENAAYKQLFPDKHFDLDTILRARVRPILEASERSFVGFFQPEGINDDTCGFLQGALSFDKIWEEINEQESFEGAIYIVSWNDHFFVLKVEENACYMIDTLGERLYEGCNQAYMLCFNDEAVLSSVPKKNFLGTSSSSGCDPRAAPLCTSCKESASCSNTVSSSKMVTPNFSSILSAPQHEGQKTQSANGGDVEASKETPSNCKAKAVRGCDAEESIEIPIVYQGKNACKQFIKGFLAALPLRELEQELQKGNLEKIPLHLLQIDFHFTRLDHTAYNA